jgi:ParB family chromosome partitioning protein
MAFNIKDFLNEESKKEIKDDFPIEKIPVSKLHPSEKNFYNIDPGEIQALKDSIELVGVQENLVVREINTGEFKSEYEIIAGHKRHLAVSELVAEGKMEGLVPCKIDYSGSTYLQELILIFTNSTQRERSDYEKMYEVQRVRELLDDYSRNNDLQGRKRDIIAGILNTSKSTIARLDNIRRHISTDFMEEYKAGKIPTYICNEIAGTSEDEQETLWETYQQNGCIKKSDVDALRQKRQIEVQMVVEDYPEFLPEDTTLGQKEQYEHIETKEQSGKTSEERENVSLGQQDDSKWQKETVNTSTLFLNGAINTNKEYDKMNVRYFMDAVTNSGLFDEEFWRRWKEPGRDYEEVLKQYNNRSKRYKSISGEIFGYDFDEDMDLTLVNQETQQAATIYKHNLIDLINTMIYTGTIKQETRTDVAYQGKQTARELARFAMWLTEGELEIMQEIEIRLKERAAKR